MASFMKTTLQNNPLQVMSMLSKAQSSANPFSVPPVGGSDIYSSTPITSMQPSPRKVMEEQTPISGIWKVPPGTSSMGPKFGSYGTEHTSGRKRSQWIGGNLKSREKQQPREISALWRESTARTPKVPIPSRMLSTISEETSASIDPLVGPTPKRPRTQTISSFPLSVSPPSLETSFTGSRTPVPMQLTPIGPTSRALTTTSFTAPGTSATPTTSPTSLPTSRALSAPSIISVSPAKSVSTGTPQLQTSIIQSTPPSAGPSSTVLPEKYISTLLPSEEKVGEQYGTTSYTAEEGTAGTMPTQPSTTEKPTPITPSASPFVLISPSSSAGAASATSPAVVSQSGTPPGSAFTPKQAIPQYSPGSEKSATALKSQLSFEPLSSTSLLQSSEPYSKESLLESSTPSSGQLTESELSSKSPRYSSEELSSQTYPSITTSTKKKKKLRKFSISGKPLPLSSYMEEESELDEPRKPRKVTIEALTPKERKGKFLERPMTSPRLSTYSQIPYKYGPSSPPGTSVTYRRPSSGYPIVSQRLSLGPERGAGKASPSKEEPVSDPVPLRYVFKASNDLIRTYKLKSIDNLSDTISKSLINYNYLLSEVLLPKYTESENINMIAKIGQQIIDMATRVKTLAEELI